MGRDFQFRLQELRSLHSSLSLVFLLLLALTVSLLAYMAVRIFLLPDGMTLVEFGSLCLFAFACVVLCVAQLWCLRRMRSETREKIEKMTFLDELTGVSNYRSLDQQLAEELQKAALHGYPVAVVYIDLDGFKMVNDTYGHESGNSVLRSISHILRASVRTVDLVGRVGGDEFVVVMPQTDGSGGLIAAERLRAKFEGVSLRAITGEELPFIGLSMGVASYPADGQTREELIRAADEAMYRGKRAGGGRVCL